MKCNLAIWDRILRFLFGVGLMTYAFAGGPIWAFSGIYFLMTASWGLCPFYIWLKIRTN